MITIVVSILYSKMCCVGVKMFIISARMSRQINAAVKVNPVTINDFIIPFRVTLFIFLFGEVNLNVYWFRI